MSYLKNQLIRLGSEYPELRPAIRGLLHASRSVRISISYTPNIDKTFKANIAGGGRGSVGKWGYEKYALRELAPMAETPNDAFLGQYRPDPKKITA